VIAGGILKRFEAFDLPVSHLDSSDILEILPLAGTLIDKVRAESAPQVLALETARLGTHSKGDDTRTEEKVAELWRTRDPVAIHGARLTEEARQTIHKQVDDKLKIAFQATAGYKGQAQ
jgi:TPP-dependent pyruvate/acetoin dehydrogenase alpha subunit